jgi:Flp pilus assembly protein protease CpaA
MQVDILYPVALCALAAVLIVIAIVDVMQDNISNKAVLFVAFCGLSMSAARFVQHEIYISLLGVLSAVGICAILVFAFSRGIIGGGVAKLTMALLTWFDSGLYLPLLFSIMIAGLPVYILWRMGILDNAATVSDPGAASGTARRIPFGLSVAFGSAYPIYEVLHDNGFSLFA